MTRRIADYELVEELGEGNHGRFYKARPPQRLATGDDFVAVKVLDQQSDEDGFRRFANELKLLAAVDSPFLARILDAGQQEGILFYAMAFHPSGSLQAGAANMESDEILSAVARAARGAHALHEVGVAHRDIKPANILLGEKGAVLSDLGLAQVLNPGQTVTGRGPIGSIEYMAPAVILGEPASRASDVWSLGATLHRALTGKSVLGDIPTNDVLAALRHVLDATPQVDPSLTDGVGPIIERCVDAATEEPFVTGEALAEAVEGAQ